MANAISAMSCWRCCWALAAGANLLGGLLIARRQWSRHYLKYFIALGAGFMLATAMIEMIPESVKLRGDSSSLFFNSTSAVFMIVLAGYFLVHFFEHTLAPHFHFGEETHHEEISHAHASYAALLGLVIHTFFDGVAIASGLAGFELAGRRDFRGDLPAQDSRGIHGGVADAGERAEPASGVRVVGDFGSSDARGHGADVCVAKRGGGRAAVFGGRDAVRGGVGSDSGSKSRAGSRYGRAGFSRASRFWWR